jgi:signal transduction histidine kinase
VRLSGDPVVDVDPGQMRECLFALLENALDATRDPERVAVEVAIQAAAGGRREVRFDIRDEGPGIPESELSRIFDAFYTTKPGLGLPLAQTLVRQNGGRLLVESQPGGGAVFSVVLPEAA